ncbi:MAG: 50S ribosome-binding GTPase [Thermoplasmatales archaeon]|nr:50S ribosome-binding GTPase [Thermoplasmatales archaeon]
MSKIPTVMTGEEIIDTSFRKASKVNVEDKIRVFRLRKTAAARISSVADTIDTTMRGYVSSFPNFDAVPRFYFELSDLLIGVDKIKNALGGLDWCRKTVKKIGDKGIKQIKGSRNEKFIENKKKEVYGRISSVVKQVSDELLFLSNAREKLQNIPFIENIPTVVVAGYPNVGKSLLVRKISSGKPKIAAYPFTTKGISVGHFQAGYKKYQVIDTPGLLDREFSKRSNIEKQAITALKHLGNVIVFIIDPTTHCGYPLDAQLRLLNAIKETFNIPVIGVENKCDILSTDSGRLKISALTGKGIEKLMENILGTLRG